MAKSYSLHKLYLLQLLVTLIVRSHAGHLNSLNSLFMMASSLSSSLFEGNLPQLSSVAGITGASEFEPVSSPSALICTALADDFRHSVRGKYNRFPLPDKLIVGYANWNQCDDKIVESVKSGVNVVIWFAVNLVIDKITGLPIVEGGPDMDCVAEKIEQIRNLDPPCPTTHLISIGGWNAPHPDTTHTAEAVYQAWRMWNTETIVNPDRGFYGFDGLDWDIEGNDDHDSPYNTFTPGVLDLMGGVSQRAKRDGFVVAMAPMESYLDPSTHNFSRGVTHTYPEWTALQPPFRYHGRNVYSYLLARYGTTHMPRSPDGEGEGTQGVAAKPTAEKRSGVEVDVEATESVAWEEVDTFDFVTVQLYEGYSHMQYQVQVLRQSPALMLVEAVRALCAGWDVHFDQDPSVLLERRLVRVKHTQLVIGLANGWAGDGKFLLLYPDQVEAAYNQLFSEQQQPKGFAFWNILDEGRVPPHTKQSSLPPTGDDVKGVLYEGGDGKDCYQEMKPLWLGRELNKFLKIREET